MNEMVLTLTNSGSAAVSLVGLCGAAPFAQAQATAGGPTALYVMSQRVVQDAQQPFLEWQAEGWTAKYFGGSNSAAWGLYPHANASLAAGASLQFRVTNWTFPTPAGVPEQFAMESVAWYGVDGTASPFGSTLWVHVTYVPGAYPYLSEALSMELVNSSVTVTTPGGHVVRLGCSVRCAGPG